MEAGLRRLKKLLTAPYWRTCTVASLAVSRLSDGCCDQYDGAATGGERRVAVRGPLDVRSSVEA